VASRGYCWGRHLRLTPKTFGCEQRGSEAIGEGEEGASEELGAKCDERRSKLPEEKRRGDPRSEGIAHGPKRQAAKRLRGPLRFICEDPRTRREAKRSETTPLSEFSLLEIPCFPRVSIPRERMKNGRDQVSLGSLVGNGS